MITEQQNRAVTGIFDKNILISAAAGSGKTSTLTDRILYLITDKGADIRRMLIVTFTRAAAGELRERIASKLSEKIAENPENKALRLQLSYLGSAPIKTIDAYYSDFVRTHFEELGLPARFRVDDGSESTVLALDVMKAVIETLLADENHADFHYVTDLLSTIKTTSETARALISLYDRFMKYPEGTSLLEDCARKYEEESGMDFFASRAGRVFRDGFAEKFVPVREEAMAAIASIRSNACDFTSNELNTADETERYLERIAQVIGDSSYQGLCDAVSAAPKFTLRKNKNSPDKHEVIDAIHAAVSFPKDYLKTFGDVKEYSTPDTIRKVQRTHAVLCRELKAALDLFDERFDAEKRQRSVCLISDLKRFTLRLLMNADGTPTATAAEEAKKFDFIFVDEYQDTDYVQDTIFHLICRGNNLFFVGDIKQSIYMFRGAEPALFAHYRNDVYRDDDESENVAIYMSENFRCSRNVINMTNAVCSFLFRAVQDRTHKGIGYRPETDDLVYYKDHIPNIDPSQITNEKVHIRLFETIPAPAYKNAAYGEKEDEDVGSESTPETEYVVSEIRKLLENGRKPDEIAILCPDGSHLKTFSDALNSAGIRAAGAAKEDLFENAEVQLLISLLSAIDNPQRDIPLAAALRSEIFGFTVTDLVNVRMFAPDVSLYESLRQYAASEEAPDAALAARCGETVRRLGVYRDLSEAMPIHRFIRAVWKECDVSAFIGTDENTLGSDPHDRRKSILSFYDFARCFDGNSFKSLHDFVTFITGLIETGRAKELPKNNTAGCVNLMTIHGSKGLEFPVVFLSGIGGRFHPEDGSVFWCRDYDLGLCSEVPDDAGLYKIKSPLYYVAKKILTGQVKEDKIRCLYVAMTRARDVLYVTSHLRSSTKCNYDNFVRFDPDPVARDRIMDAKNYTQWIWAGVSASLVPLGKEKIEHDFFDYEYTCVDLSQSADADATSGTDAPEIAPAAQEEPPSVNEELAEELLGRFRFRYRYSQLTKIPAKLSVSRLSPDVLTEEDIAERDLAEADAALRMLDSLPPRTPRFMGGQEATASERGTATHLFLQFCDFGRLDGTEDAARAEAERLTGEGFIPPETAALIRYDEIAAFSASAFFGSLRSARDVRRETRFNIFLPAADFTTDPALKDAYRDEKLMVQGVIDLFFIDAEGRLILCDYKTDRLSEWQLANPERARRKMQETHAEQLGYYAAALTQMTGRKPDRVCVFSLHLGRDLDIDI